MLKETAVTYFMVLTQHLNRFVIYSFLMKRVTNLLHIKRCHWQQALLNFIIAHRNIIFEMTCV